MSLPSLAIKVHEKGFRVPVDFEEVEFISPKPIAEFIRGKITKEELKKRMRKRAEGKQVAMVFIEMAPGVPGFAEVKIVYYNVPEKKYVYFTGKEFRVSVMGEIIDGFASIDDFPTLTLYMDLDRVAWIVENFKSFTEECFRLLGVR